MTKSNNKVDLTPIVILAVGGVIRVIYLLQLSSTPFAQHPILDAEYYFTWGTKLAWGGLWVLPDFQGNPLYPYFLAFLIRIMHAEPLLIRVIQHGLGLVTCLLIYHSGKILFSRATGFLAALFYAVYIPAVFYEGWFLSASLTTFLAAALLFFLISDPDNSRRIHWFEGGIIAGLTILGRPTLMPLGILIWSFFPSGKQVSGKNKAPLLFLAGFLVILVPAGIFFSLGSGEIMIFPAHGGENFYIGNNPNAGGGSKIPDFARGSPSLQHDDFIRTAEQRTGRALTPGENSSFWFGQALRFIAGHPLTFASRLVYKIYLFFSANNISDNYNLIFFKQLIPILRFPFTWHILSTLGILGMIAGWRKKKKIAPLYLLTFCYTISIAFFFISGRFRLPTAPYLAIFGAIGIQSIIRTIREKKTKSTVGLIIAGGVIFFGLSSGTEKTPLYASYLSAGEIYYRDGDYKGALSYLQKARDGERKAGILNNQRFYRIHYALGQTYLGLNQSTEAAEEFKLIEDKILNSPLEPEFDIGNAYAAHRFYREAKNHYLNLLDSSPDHYRAWNNLGMVYKKEGAYNQAVETFKKAIKNNPEYSAPHVNLGNIYVKQGKYEAALKEFATALELDPSLRQLHLSAAFCLQKLNRFREAEIEAKQCPRALMTRKY